MAKDKASQEDIYRQMRQDIEGGIYPSSTRLPSVRTLAKRFKASPNTISKVVSRLMESGLCTARRGVGLFVRSLPTRKMTLLVGSTSAEPEDNFYGCLELGLNERLAAEGIEIERYHITSDDPSYGPAIERIRRPGRVLLCIGLTHEPHLKALSELRRPMLILGHSPSRSNASSIVSNNFRSGYLSARYLIKKGCRRISFIGQVRRIRQVVLPEAESLKQMAGVQCAIQEEGLNLLPEFTFRDIEDAGQRIDALSDHPDGLIMPDSDDITAVKIRKNLVENKSSIVTIGDDRILERAKFSTSVVTRRDEIVELAVVEILRLLGEQRVPPRSYTVDTELHEGVG
ncbi:MAG: GntR family transcriptional regulator [Planctomycetes bacterium]|nr:GntR family transcriptional regulator [Planctomycetota bacterium]